MGMWYMKEFKEAMEKHEEVDWLIHYFKSTESLSGASQTLIGTVDRDVNVSIEMTATGDGMLHLFVEDEFGKELGSYLSDDSKVLVEKALNNAFIRFIHCVGERNKSVDMLVYDAYHTAINRGWHKEKTEFGTLLALVHTEVTEAVEANNSEELAEELGDIVIRIFDLCGYFEIDLAKPFSKTFGVTNMYDIYKKLESSRVQGLTKENTLMVHTHITKVMEVYRLPLEEQAKKERLAENLAQVVKYVLQMSYWLGVDSIFLQSLENKMEKNKKRNYKHGGKIV